MIRIAPLITIYDLETSIECIGEMTLLFSSNLKGISNTRQRLNIHVLKPDEIERTWTEGSIKSIWIKFDEISFSKLSESGKKEAIINLITASFLKIANEANWNKQAILDAKEACRNQQLKFNFITKPKNKKGNQASIKLNLKNGKVIINFILNIKGQPKMEIKALETFSAQIFTWKYFNKFHWLNENEFGFTFSNNITYSYSISEGKFNWKYEDTEENRQFINTITKNEFAPFVKWN